MVKQQTDIPSPIFWLSSALTSWYECHCPVEAQNLEGGGVVQNEKLHGASMTL